MMSHLTKIYAVCESLVVKESKEVLCLLSKNRKICKKTYLASLRMLNVNPHDIFSINTLYPWKDTYNLRFDDSVPCF